MPAIQKLFVVSGDGVTSYNTVSQFASLIRGTEQGREADYELFTDENEANARFQRRENEHFIMQRVKMMDPDTFTTLLEFLQSLEPGEKLRRIVHTSR